MADSTIVKEISVEIRNFIGADMTLSFGECRIWNISRATESSETLTEYIAHQKKK